MLKNKSKEIFGNHLQKPYNVIRSLKEDLTQWRNTSCSNVEELKTVREQISPKLIYGLLNAVLFKIPVGYIMDFYKSF